MAKINQPTATTNHIPVPLYAYSKGCLPGRFMHRCERILCCTDAFAEADTLPEHSFVGGSIHGTGHCNKKK